MIKGFSKSFLKSILTVKPKEELAKAIAAELGHVTEEDLKKTEEILSREFERIDNECTAGTD